MKDLIKRKPLISFFFLAYLLSWIFWLLAVFAGTIDEELALLLMLVGVLGPMASGFIVSRILGTSKQFWKISFKWKVPFKWYVISIGLPLIVLLFVRLIGETAGVAETESTAIQTLEGGPWYMFPLVMLFMVFVGGGLEEPGWRGFAQLRMLERFTPFTASIILGIIWTYWHTPLYFVPGSSQESMELIKILWYTAAVISMSLILTMIFIRSKGSAFLAIIFHAAANAINSWIFDYRVVIAGNKFDSFIITEIMYVLIAVVIVVLNRKLFFSRVKTSDYLDV